MRPKIGGAPLSGRGTFPPIVSDYQPWLTIRISCRYLKDVVTGGRRCKSNSDHEFELNGRESQYSFHNCLLTKVRIFTTHDCLLQSWRHAIATPSFVSPAHLHVPRPGPLRPLQPGRDWPVAAQTLPEAKATEDGAYSCRHSVAPPIEESLYRPRKSSAWKLTLPVNGKCLNPRPGRGGGAPPPPLRFFCR